MNIDCSTYAQYLLYFDHWTAEIEAYICKLHYDKDLHMLVDLRLLMKHYTHKVALDCIISPECTLRVISLWVGA